MSFVHGSIRAEMRCCCVLVAVMLAPVLHLFSAQAVTIDVVDNWYGIRCYKISSAMGDFYWELGGDGKSSGFKSLVDKNGEDWVQANIDVGVDWRGFPNLINNWGHPSRPQAGNYTNEPSASLGDHITLPSGQSGTVDAELHFFETHAAIRFNSINGSFAFLFEGTPPSTHEWQRHAASFMQADGTEYVPSDVFCVSHDWPKDPTTDGEWYYMKASKGDVCFWVAHTPNTSDVSESYRDVNVGGNMDVISFGRNCTSSQWNALLTGAHHVGMFGFISSSLSHDEIAAHIRKVMANPFEPLSSGYITLVPAGAVVSPGGAISLTTTVQPADLSVTYTLSGGGALSEQSNTGVTFTSDGTAGEFEITAQATTAEDEAITSIAVISVVNPADIHLKIDCGAQAATGWEDDDQYASGGATYAFEQSVNTTGVESAAPEAVYLTVRHGTDHAYTIPVPDATYTVRLHHVDFSGPRAMDISIEGELVLDNFDPTANAGGEAGKASVSEFPVTVADGDITIDVQLGDGNDAFVSGIEIIGSQSSGNSFSAAPRTGHTGAVRITHDASGIRIVPPAANRSVWITRANGRPAMMLSGKSSYMLGRHTLQPGVYFVSVRDTRSGRILSSAKTIVHF